MEVTAEASALYAPPGRGRAAAPLDAAVEHLRAQWTRLLPLYLVGVAPLAVGMLMVIDAITAGHRSALAPACAVVTTALPWRWLILAMMQRRVQQQLRGSAPLPLRQRWLSILVLRLWACLALTWGGFVIILPFYGLFLGGFAAPLLLEEPGPAFARVRQVLTWSTNALVPIGIILLMLTLLVFLAVVSVQLVLVGTVLPSLLGLDMADLRVTLSGAAWMLILWFGVFLALDFFWSVAAVFVFYALQARRLGTDLRQRLAQLQEAVT